MKNYARNAFTGLSLFALILFTGSGLGAGFVHAQTTSGSNQQSQTAFNQDVEEGVQEVKNDQNAQNNQQEIDNEDNENAGDEHGDVKEVDGENNQAEIDDEIEQEVDQEDAANGQSSDQENSSASSMHNGTSGSVDTEIDNQ